MGISPGDAGDTRAAPDLQETTSEAARRDGAVWLRTTPQGLPLDLRIEPSWMTRGPQALAAEIVTLCELARLRAGADYRQRLADAGFQPDALADLPLPTRAEVANFEQRLDDEDDEVGSWLEK